MKAWATEYTRNPVEKKCLISLSPELKPTDQHHGRLKLSIRESKLIFDKQLQFKDDETVN